MRPLRLDSLTLGDECLRPSSKMDTTKGPHARSGSLWFCDPEASIEGAPS